MKAWHECALSLKTPRDPVVTPAGVVYDREAILNHLLMQKERARSKREEQKRRDAAERDASRRLADEQRTEEERRAENGLHLVVHSDSSVVKGTDEGRSLKSDSVAPNFWLPGMNVAAQKRARPTSPLEQNTSGKRSKSEKHSAKTLCPVSGNSLRLRDLITIRPTPTPLPSKPLSSAKANRSNCNEVKNDKDTTVAAADGNDILVNDSIDDSNDGANHGEDINHINHEDVDADHVDEDASSGKRDSDTVGGIGNGSFHSTPFVCALCRTPLSNAAKPVALRTGTVLCAHCVDAFVRRDRRDPLTTAVIDVAHDVIVIDNSGTAFAGSTPKNPGSREARIYRPSVT